MSDSQDMSRKYYIAADGGGTKLHAVLFGDDLKPVSFGVGKSVNNSFVDTADVKATMDECVDMLFASDEARCIGAVEMIFSTIVGPYDIFADSIRRYATVGGVQSLSEGYGALAGGALRRTGILALAGTGSDVYYIRDGKCLSVIGGWGALFGDEGSGYDIGVRGLRAFQYDCDGRGPHTLLREYITRDYGLKSPFDIVSMAYSTRDYRRFVASVCLTVCHAADAGDETAIEILRSAGRELGLMTVTLIRREKIAPQIGIVLGGSVWRRNPHMQRAFAEYVNSELACSEYEGFEILPPKYNPVIGGVVHHALTNGYEKEQICALLDEYYSRHLYEN